MEALLDKHKERKYFVKSFLPKILQNQMFGSETFVYIFFKIRISETKTAIREQNKKITSIKIVCNEHQAVVDDLSGIFKILNKILKFEASKLLILNF